MKWPVFRPHLPVWSQPGASQPLKDHTCSWKRRQVPGSRESVSIRIETQRAFAGSIEARAGPAETGLVAARLNPKSEPGPMLSCRRPAPIAGTGGAAHDNQVLGARRSGGALRWAATPGTGPAEGPDCDSWHGALGGAPPQTGYSRRECNQRSRICAPLFSVSRLSRFAIRSFMRGSMLSVVPARLRPCDDASVVPMRKLRTLVSNLVTSGLPPETDGETLHRVGMVNTFSAIAFLYLALFGSVHWAAGRHAQAGAYLAIAVAAVANVAYLRRSRRVRASALLACGIAAVLCWYRLHDVPSTYGYLWSFAFPLFAVFSLGLRPGIGVTVVFALTCALALYLPANPFMPPGYTDAFKLRFLATVAGLGMMSAYTEHARMRAEIALQGSERRFRSLIENSASVYAIVSADGEVLYESPSLERVYGYRPDELVGTSIMDLVHPDDRAAAMAELVGLMQDPGQVRTAEIRYRHRDGSWRDIEVSGVCLLHDPAVRGVVLTSHDITGRKRAEREIRGLNETLEQRVQERTDALQRSEEQRLQSEKMEAIGQLAGGIAHDFNNQLAAIMSCLDLLKMALAGDAKLSGYLEAASIASRRSADLTSQLLAFARKSARRTIPVDLHRVVAEVVSLLKHSIDKRIVIRQRLGRGAHVVMGDPAQLESALLNVAINARDAMPEGGEITFATAALDLEEAVCRQQSLDVPAGRYIRLSVTDTGKGISEETRKRIFEPFFTTKRAGEGTGMGLAAAYGTARVASGGNQVDVTVFAYEFASDPFPKVFVPTTIARR